MRAEHPQICLVNPEIPQNTGAIGRLAAATCCRLHLVTPLSFSLSDRDLRRPGLDYWPYLDLEIHNDLDTLLMRAGGKIALLSKFATKPHTEIPIDTELLLFGRETTGLSLDLREAYADQCYRIPMFHPGVRSLNLANAVSIIVYDQLAKREKLA